MANELRLSSTIESQWRVDAGISDKNVENKLDLSDERNVDLIVVGLGGAGLAAARHAAEHGLSVVGIEAGHLGRGAAGSNGGFLLCGTSKFYNDAVVHFGRDFAEKVWEITSQELLQQLDEWPEVVKKTGTYRCAGWPYVRKDKQPTDYDDDVSHLIDHFNALLGSSISVDFGDLGGTPSIFIEDDGWCQPAKRLLKAREAAESAGARLYFNCPVEIDSSLDRPSAITAAGKLASRHILIATDAHLEEMFPELAGEVQTWKLQMMSAACDTDRFSVPAYMRFGYDYVAKTDDGIALGGFRDYYPDSEIASAWGGTAPLNNKIAGKLAALASMITETSLEVKTSWSSAVGYTTSGLPVVREMRPGVWVCGAYNGHGNLLSFICGKAIVDRILQNKSVVFDLFNNRG